jgi:ParB family chromosome partitioning protein
MAIGDNPLKKSKGTNSLISQFAEEDKIETAVFSLSRLVPFANHPFKLYEGERLDDLVRSVKELGVIVPIIVRLKDKPRNLYEILSGHNRVNAARLAELDSVPVIIKEGLTDEEAMLIVTETNLIQRSFADLTHSEKAIALKTHMDAIKAQGKRTDIINEINSLLKADEYCDMRTPALKVPKLGSREMTALKYGLNRMTVTRYVKLNDLMPELLSRVDNGEIGLYPAVSLSYLTTDEQTELNSTLESTSYKVDMKKAEVLRRLSAEKKLTGEKMTAILSGELNKKPKPQTPPPLKIKHKVYSKHFAKDITQKEMEEIIDKALTEYFNNHKKEE